MIDLENSVTVTDIKLGFPKEGNYRYKVQLTADGDHWIDIADQSASTSTLAKREHKVVGSASGRSLRILFTGLPEGIKAAISEIEVVGKN